MNREGDLLGIFQSFLIEGQPQFLPYDPILYNEIRGKHFRTLKHVSCVKVCKMKRSAFTKNSQDRQTVRSQCLIVYLVLLR